MKLNYIANIRIPTEKAHGAQIMKMCEAFSLAGAEVSLIVPKRRNRNFANITPFDFYQIKKIFKLKKLWIIDPVILLRLPAGFYIKGQLLLFCISLFFHLIFNRSKDQVYYTRDEFLLPLLQIFSGSVVWEAHALPRNLDFYLPYIKACKKIIVLTAQIKNLLVEKGVAQEMIMVNGDAVDLEIFDVNSTREQARIELRLPADKVILGYTGSFKTKGMDKGISDILKAVKSIGKEFDLLFVAVGGNEADITEYQNQAKELGVLESCLFLPKVDQRQLAVYQKAFDVLLMPFPFNQHYAYYMSPLKMFEYLAAKRPIIASDLPSIKEVLSAETAIFCRPDDPVDLAEKIKLALNDKMLAEKISLNSYELAKKYSWNNRAEVIINFIG